MWLHFTGGLFPTRAKWRRFLHWNYSGWFIGLAWSTGVALTFVHDQLQGAYIGFALAGAWSVGYWMTSDALEKKYRFSQARISPRERRRRKQSFYLLKYAVLALLVAFTFGCMRFALSEQKSYQQDDAYTHLGTVIALPTDGNVIRSLFTLKNESRYRVYVLFSGCAINDLAWSDGDHEDGYAAFFGRNSNFSLGIPATIKPEVRVLNRGGDAESGYCLDQFYTKQKRPYWEGPANLRCADLTIELFYVLSPDAVPKYITLLFQKRNRGLLVNSSDKPHTILTKGERFVFLNGQWQQQLVGNNQSFCGGLPPNPRQQ